MTNQIKRHALSNLASAWLNQGALFLDTETTGLDESAEAIEIGLVDGAGRIVYETRLKPVGVIGRKAAAVHKIKTSDLVGAPSWPDISQQLQSCIGHRPLVIFNAAFDVRILKQTAGAHNERADWLNELDVYCAMMLAAGFYGATNSYGTISLASAVSKAGLQWSGRPHAAVTDAVMTAKLVQKIAAHK